MVRQQAAPLGQRAEPLHCADCPLHQVPKEPAIGENKTRANANSVATYLAAVTDAQRQRDCRTLSTLMQRLTGHPAAMWGTGIVGFGSYHYRYASGREGDAAETGFAARKGDISVYLTTPCDGQEALLARLGRHKMGKACLSIQKLADVDMVVLAELISGSVAELRRRYPPVDPLAR